MREKRTRSQERNEPFFDYKLDDFDAKKSFLVSYDDVSGTSLSFLAKAGETDLAATNEQLKLVSKPKYSNSVPHEVSADDPLDPDIFIGHHRRMEREERRMQVQERQQLMVMASRIRGQKEALVRPDWKSSIEKIVRISDSNDLNELRRKRDLVLSEMDTFLTKFEEYNKRINRRDTRGSKDCNEKTKDTKPTNKGEPTKKTKPASKPKVTKNVLPAAESFTDDEDLFISIRPTAFGYMVPPRIFPPREFEPPKLIVDEVEVYELVEKLIEERSKLVRR